MSDPRALAAAYGIRIERTDLGTWGEATLVSEYDPSGPVIRINERAIDRLRAILQRTASSCEIRTLIDAAIAHELYHHAEHIGEIEPLPTHAQREAAADAFARAHVAIDPELDAFLRGVRG